MINIHWLHTFCTLAEVGHFSKTADKLFMTQSGVSQQLKKLEQQLETELLNRQGKSFTLTDAGLKLYQQGKLLLSDMDELENQVKQDEPYTGKITIASPGSVGLKLYPYLLQIQQQYPELTFDYQFAPNKTIEQGIINRETDLGLVTESNPRPELNYTQLAQEPLLLVTHSQIEHIDWQQLLSMGFISHPDARHHADLLLGRNFEQYQHIKQFKQAGFSNQIALILEPVALGLGFTVLPQYAISAFQKQADICLHHLPCPVSEPLYLCTHNNAFITRRNQFIQQQIRQFLN